jgi:hypothetical protein
VFSYKGRELSAQKVGKELGVDAVLLGRIAQRGDTLTIQTDLVSVAYGSELWGAQYNRKVADLLSVQEDISKEIYDNLRPKLTGQETPQLSKHYTENPEAYQLYLQGLYYWNKWTERGFTRAIDYFSQAVEKDPKYALAYAGLADAHTSWVIPATLPLRKFAKTLRRQPCMLSRSMTSCRRRILPSRWFGKLTTGIGQARKLNSNGLFSLIPTPPTLTSGTVIF